jgi:NADH dehydrogenase
MLEAASVEPDPGRRKRMLTFVVAGSGFAGVETVGAINDLARESLPHYGRVVGAQQKLPGSAPIN